LLFILATLYGLHRYHISRTLQKIKAHEAIRKEEISKIRQILARDFHDEMGNKLASITVLTSALDLLIKEKPQQVQEVLDNLENTSKDLFTGTKSFIWSMDPDSDNLKEIIAYIQHFAVDLLKNSGISFSITPKLDELPTLVLPMGYSRQIYFIFKEAITNAMVHSNAKSILLLTKVIINKNQFEIELSDNGDGLENEETFGKGLHNMTDRANKINSQLSHFNNKKGGFTVKLQGLLPGS